jgi:2',3'-cyclic-nucleotide 2'-phosphodiesterase/3'-nucleotidase
MNDFHGSVAYDDYAGEIGINRLADYFNEKKAANPEGTIITASGDMWQGSADSNITRGHLVTDAMDLIGFDAMAIGNHEFDWGIDAIRGNIEMADFPILGANVINGATGKPADFLLPYTMIQRQGVRIGIVGTIGEYLESDILTSALAGHYFDNIDNYVAEAASDLDALGADVKILINHNSSVSYAALQYVDLAFNGHSHSYQSDLNDGRPVVQAYSNGKAVGSVRLTYNKNTDAVNIVNYGVDEGIAYDGYEEDPVMAAMYQVYYDRDIKDIKEEVLGTAEYAFSKSAIGNLVVDLMYELGQTRGARVAIHNSGGIRASIAAGEVTYGDVYKALTFDNYVVTLDLTGTQLKSWLSRGGYVEGYDGSRFTDDNSSIVNTNMYTIVTINYLSENTAEYPNDGINLFNTGAYPREMVAQAWRDAGSLNPYDYI